ncbi:glycoside hydrolase family 28 protein [Acinetobacter sp. CUI P1]|nr:glycoside hydrolase family 28 protein [Acinetobacter sp. CUI P1]
MHPAPTTNLTTITLFSPPAAQTADSIALLWDKPATPGEKHYEVYANNTLVVSTRNTDYTLQGLDSETEYDIYIRAYATDEKPLQSNTLSIATKPASQVFDITSYSAVGDGEALNTDAIQTAIDACSEGGIVNIPAGVFLSGALYLKSDMTLYLNEGAVLLGSPDTKDYPLIESLYEGQIKTCYASLINTPVPAAGRLRNITIAGPGKIDANGSALIKKELSEAKGKRGSAICIRNTDNVYLEDITVRQSPFWCVHIVYCNGVSVNGVSIHTKYDEEGKKYEGIFNGDGLDPDSCSGVYIFNCHIASQDDGIAIKSGRNEEGRAVGLPTENVRISNCRFTSGFGVAMGSEMSGGIRNVLVEDCVFSDTFSVASVKAIRGRGSVIEDVTYRDCTFTNHSLEFGDTQWFRGALYIDQFYGDLVFDPHEGRPVDESTPVIRNILFQNITLDTVAGNAIYLTGLLESPLENIRLENITAVGKYGFIANNVRGLELNHVSVDAREGESMRFINVK